MFSNLKDNISAEFTELLSQNNVKPYIFKTRLERLLTRASTYATQQSRHDIVAEIEEIEAKIKYISDQSNQAPDGTLKSFSFLESDLKSLYSNIIAH